MKYNPDIHHRRSIRLKQYDYSSEGAYFVTICAQHRQCLFGDVMDGEMRLNDAGKIILSVWDELPLYYPGANVDAFVVMPNHIHGIIVLTVGAGPRACPENRTARPEKGQPQGVAPTMPLPDLVQRFKSLTTSRYRHGVMQFRWPSFPGKLWQRNYYEHIIRNEDELNRIRQYICDNPSNWETDEENPNGKSQL